MFDVSRKQEFVKPSVVRTRQADKIVLVNEVARCGIYARSPYIVGCSLWNTLDANVQKIEQKNVYKTRLKELYNLRPGPNT